MATTLGELAERFGCELSGDPTVRVDHVATLQDAGPGAVGFLSNPRYRRHLTTTRASAVILAAEDAGDCPVPALVHPNPYLVYARVAALLHPRPDWAPGIAAGAVVDPGAEVAADARIGPCAVVEAGARIGERCYVGPGCVVAGGAVLGADCRLVANVTLCHGVTLGNRVLLHPGVVIGGDGFGIARDDGRWEKVPQLGSVRVGDDVEIGANTTVDRGAIGDTVLGNGVKLDNQIQVGHNVVIGEHTVVAGCTGISGSVVIGRRCMIAGQVGIAGHLEICDDVVVTGQTVVSGPITEPGVYSGALGFDEARRWRRNSARFRHLDELAGRVRRLETERGRQGDKDDD